MFSFASKWEIPAYVLLIIGVWSFIRFFSTTLINFYRSFSEQSVVVDPFINGVKYPVSYWTEKGGRPYQEDRHHEMKGIGPKDSSLYGVFDGHGGYKAAQYCKEYLLQSIIKDSEFEKNPAQAIFNSFYKWAHLTLSVWLARHSLITSEHPFFSFRRVDKEFSAKARTQMLTDGTTSIVAIIHDKKIFIGNGTFISLFSQQSALIDQLTV